MISKRSHPAYKNKPTKSYKSQDDTLSSFGRFRPDEDEFEANLDFAMPKRTTMHWWEEGYAPMLNEQSRPIRTLSAMLPEHKSSMSAEHKRNGKESEATEHKRNVKEASNVKEGGNVKEGSADSTNHASAYISSKQSSALSFPASDNLASVTPVMPVASGTTVTTKQYRTSKNRGVNRHQSLRDIAEAQQDTPEIFNEWGVTSHNFAQRLRNKANSKRSQSKSALQSARSLVQNKSYQERLKEHWLQQTPDSNMPRDGLAQAESYAQFIAQHRAMLSGQVMQSDQPPITQMAQQTAISSTLQQDQPSKLQQEQSSKNSSTEDITGKHEPTETLSLSVLDNKEVVKQEAGQLKTEATALNIGNGGLKTKAALNMDVAAASYAEQVKQLQQQSQMQREQQRIDSHLPYRQQLKAQKQMRRLQRLQSLESQTATSFDESSTTFASWHSAAESFEPSFASYGVNARYKSSNLYLHTQVEQDRPSASASQVNLSSQSMLHDASINNTSRTNHPTNVNRVNHALHITNDDVELDANLNTDIDAAVNTDLNADFDANMDAEFEYDFADAYEDPASWERLEVALAKESVKQAEHNKFRMEQAELLAERNAEQSELAAVVKRHAQQSQTASWTGGEPVLVEDEDFEIADSADIENSVDATDLADTEYLDLPADESEQNWDEPWDTQHKAQEMASFVVVHNEHPTVKSKVQSLMSTAEKLAMVRAMAQQAGVDLHEQPLQLSLGAKDKQSDGAKNKLSIQRAESSAVEPPSLGDYKQYAEPIEDISSANSQSLEDEKSSCSPQIDCVDDKALVTSRLEKTARSQQTAKLVRTALAPDVCQLIQEQNGVQAVSLQDAFPSPQLKGTVQSPQLQSTAQSVQPAESRRFIEETYVLDDSINPSHGLGQDPSFELELDDFADTNLNETQPKRSQGRGIGRGKRRAAGSAQDNGKDPANGKAPANATTKKSQPEDVLAFNYMVQLLTRREYSKSELRQKLKDRYSPEAVEKALTRCEEYGYQSDSRHAEMLVRHMQFSGYGPQKLYLEARRKGADTDEIKRLAAEVDWEEIAFEVLSRKYTVQQVADYKVRSKVLAFLARRGFNADCCYSALRRLQNSEENR